MPRYPQPPLASAPDESTRVSGSGPMGRFAAAGVPGLLGGGLVAGLALGLGCPAAAVAALAGATGGLLLVQSLRGSGRELRLMAMGPERAAAATDRDDRRRLEAAAEGNRQRMDRLQQALHAHPAPLLMWEAGRHGRIWWANPAALAALPDPGDRASTVGDVVGRPIGEVLPRATLATLRAARVPATGSESLEELPWGARTVDANLFRLGGDDGTGIPGDMGLTWNDGVAADALQRAKDAVLSCVSHELRTPLTNVQAYAELLQGLEPGDRDEHQEFTGVLLQESQRMSDRIDRIMDLAQLEADETSWRFEELRPEEWLREKLEAWRPRLEAGGLRLEMMAGESLGTVVLDRRWVGRMLDELLQNALDHAGGSAGEGQRVVCELQVVGEVVHLAVHDDGAGVPAADLPRLGAAFEQIERDGAGKPDGLGLGLALVGRIAARHGGYMRLEASPMGGLVVHLLLPRAAHQVDQAEVASAAGGATVPARAGAPQGLQGANGPLTQR